jgi:flagellar hook-basal body complex protein FliE
MTAIDPTLAINGAEWQIGSVEGPAPAQESGSSFGKILTDLTATQTDAAAAAQDLASGKATDPTAVVMAVERAQLSMQMAAQIRTKAVEAAQTIFSTQV